MATTTSLSPAWLQQRRQALTIANAQRVGGGNIKADVASLPRSEAQAKVADMLENPSQVVGGMRVGGLVRSIPWVGHSKLHYMLSVSGIWSVDTRVDRLSERQRTALVALLRRQR